MGRWSSVRLKLVVPFAVLVVLLPSYVLGEREEELASIQAVHLLDGSIIVGKVSEDGAGGYVVSTKYGELSVSAEDVLYVAKDEEKTGVRGETHILTGNKGEVIAILQKAIPERREDAPVFGFLLPGSVVEVSDLRNRRIPYQALPAGAFTRLGVRYEDVGPKDKYLLITVREGDFLKSDDESGHVYQHSLTPDRGVVFELRVQHPQDWQVARVSPEPTTRYPAMILWRIELKKQQDFTPFISFR